MINLKSDQTHVLQVTQLQKRMNILNSRTQLFREQIMLSNGQISMKQICVNKTYCTFHHIKCYSVDITLSALKPLGPVQYTSSLTSCKRSFCSLHKWNPLNILFHFTHCFGTFVLLVMQNARKKRIFSKTQNRSHTRHQKSLLLFQGQYSFRRCFIACLLIQCQAIDIN